MRAARSYMPFAWPSAAGDADLADPGDWLVFLLEVHDTTEDANPA